MNIAVHRPIRPAPRLHRSDTRWRQVECPGRGWPDSETVRMLGVARRLPPRPAYKLRARGHVSNSRGDFIVQANVGFDRQSVLVLRLVQDFPIGNLEMMRRCDLLP